METRGSLKNMILSMDSMFDRTRAQRLGIYQVPGGKYYNLTDSDLFIAHIRTLTELDVISFIHLSRRELHSILRTNQLSLILGDEHEQH